MSIISLLFYALALSVGITIPIGAIYLIWRIIQEIRKDNKNK